MLPLNRLPRKGIYLYNLGGDYNGKESKRSKSPSYLGVHRAQRQRYAGYITLRYNQKPQKHTGTFGVEEIQPNPEKSYCSQRN